ncbi:MAG: cell division protein FtsZ [Oscillospiraceae bacterium]
MNFSIAEESQLQTNIKVVGIGGGGGNAINRMILSGMKGVDFIAMNTDSQILKFSKATYKLQLGGKITRGQGAGGDPERGRRAVEESHDDIASALKGTDMVFITAGMGGGTGTGGAPYVAEIAKDLGILTVGVVTKPFNFEGRRRMKVAEEGIAELKEHVDALIVIPNERLKLISEEKITLANAFEASDNVLRQGVQSISDLINVPGVINLDFADVTSIMSNAGYAHMGLGRASGEGAAERAAQAAIESPLLETNISDARGVIINFRTSQDVALEDVDLAASLITKEANEDANIIWGISYDEEMKDEMMITVIATGFDSDSETGASQGAANQTRTFDKVTAPDQKAVNPQSVNPEPPMKKEDVDDYLDDILRVFKNQPGQNRDQNSSQNK